MVPVQAGLELRENVINFGETVVRTSTLLDGGI